MIQKQKGSCGNSEFKAALEVSSQRKNLDVAGNMMGSCGHATILTSVDKKESETYRHTLLLTQEVLQERNCKVLVNDVVRHFWVFLTSLTVLLPGQSNRRFYSKVNTISLSPSRPSSCLVLSGKTKLEKIIQIEFNHFSLTTAGYLFWPLAQWRLRNFRRRTRTSVLCLFSIRQRDQVYD